LKNSDNFDAANKTREALEGLSGIVKLSEDKKEILEAIKKSDLTPKDLEAILKGIIDQGGKTWSRDILKN